jgi:hypothetical protein
MKKIVILMILILSFVSSCSAGTVSFTLDAGPYNSPPEPRLKYPIYETAIISGEQPMEFSWWNDWIDTSGYILKVYKGYNMYAGNLVLKENLPASAVFFKVKADLFEEGKVYTWSLVRVSFAGYKSDKSFNSFKVIKR